MGLALTKTLLFDLSNSKTLLNKRVFIFPIFSYHKLITFSFNEDSQLMKEKAAQDALPPNGADYPYFGVARDGARPLSEIATSTDEVKCVRACFSARPAKNLSPPMDSS